MRRVNRFSDRRIWPKRTDCHDLCGKSSEFADFGNTVDRRSVVIFDADHSGLCPSYVRILGPKRNKQQHSWLWFRIWTKKNGGSTDLAKKKARIGGFAYPYSPSL